MAANVTARRHRSNHGRIAEWRNPNASADLRRYSGYLISSTATSNLLCSSAPGLT